MIESVQPETFKPGSSTEIHGITITRMGGFTCLQVRPEILELSSVLYLVQAEGPMTLDGVPVDGSAVVVDNGDTIRTETRTMHIALGKGKRVLKIADGFQIHDLIMGEGAFGCVHVVRRLEGELRSYGAYET
jgi:hypothetical protein